LLNSQAGTPKKSCNDDMILFIFHINANIKYCGFRKGGWLASLQGWKVSLQDIFRCPCLALLIFHFNC